MNPKEIPLKALGRYSVAPYNFVSLPEKSVARYRSIRDLPAHNQYTDQDHNELMSGSIEYELKAEMPVMVSAGSDRNNHAFFFKNSKGEYAIPGNTIRGMIRSNLQILSLSNVAKDIEDKRFMFRDIAGNNALSKKYGQILDIDINKRVSRNLKTGYIYQENGKYYIDPAVELIDGVRYFRIAEKYLKKNVSPKVKGIRYMYHGDTTRYRPYKVAISFEFDNNRNQITKIGIPKEYSNEGYVLSGQYIQGKKAHYVIPAVDSNQASFEINQEMIESYKADLIATQKMDRRSEEGNLEKIKPGWEYYDLPQNGEKKPVFYIYKDDTIHFGFTPYLRMFYSKTVLDGIPSSHKDTKGISYAEGMFGFTNQTDGDSKESSGYKSRLRFEDASVQDQNDVVMENSIELLLAGPKPTSYNLYLNQDLNANKHRLNIYEGNFNIRGIKQYWFKDYIGYWKPERGWSPNMVTHLHPLKEGTSFKGRIKFKNLAKDELGLVLWALELEKDCYQSIGMGKPYGLGRIKVEDVVLKIESLDKKYSSFSFDYTEIKDSQKYIDFYKEYFSNEYKETLGNKSITQMEPIKELMYIKSKTTSISEANDYRYMAIRERQFKEYGEKKVLPSILDYASGMTNNPQPPHNPPTGRPNKNTQKPRRQHNTAMGDAFKNIGF